MVRRLLICFISMMMVAAGYAQKKEIASAKTNIKNGSNLEAVENSMLKLLGDTANLYNDNVWNLLFASLKKQYDQGNEKLYLKQKYDTTSLFQITKKLFDTMEHCDSVYALNPKKSLAGLSFRSKNASFLNRYRSNLFSGGTFYVRKQNFKDALQMFSTYIDCARQPMFSKYDYLANDTLLPEASYWALYSAYKLDDKQAILHYAELAKNDKEHYPYTLQYLAETYMATGDTTAYLNTLKTGYETYPEFKFFFPRLVDYYSDHGKYDTAMDIVEKALERDSLDVIYRFAKSSLMLNQKQFDKCIEICDQLISESDTLAEPYMNAGLAYYNQAVEVEKRTPLTRNDRNLRQTLYKKAMPYLQRFQELAPQQKNVWAPPLYNIYFNLNMGREFDEMNRLMHEDNPKP